MAYNIDLYNQNNMYVHVVLQKKNTKMYEMFASGSEYADCKLRKMVCWLACNQN